MTPDLVRELLLGLGLLACSAVLSPLLAGRRKLAGTVNFLLTAAAAAVLLRVSYLAVFGVGSREAEMVRLGPLAIPFLLDGFSGIFLGIISFMAVISALYSVKYLEHYPDYSLRGYYLCFPLFVLGMAGMVTVDDLSTGFSIAWQLMTVASFFLIRFEHRRAQNVRIANKYLVLMELAWLMVLAGTYGIGGYGFGDSTHEMAAKISQTPAGGLLAFYGLLLVGFGLKAGVFPLGQLWLPDAHSVAPSPISALLSGVMLKTGIYGLLRTFFFMTPSSAAFDERAWGAGIAALGAVTLFIGTVQSVKQSDAKRLLAYSSIGQIGYIVFAAGAALWMCAGSASPQPVLAAVAMLGALYHVLNHAIFKGLLFLTSGSVLYATGTKDLNKLGGLIQWMPVSAVLAAIASLSIAGMPPLSGFASKWTIVASSLLAGEVSAWLIVFGIVALFTSAVTLACYVKFFGMTFTSAGSEWSIRKQVREVPAAMLIPKLVLAAVCLVQGLIPFVMFGLITTAVGNSGGFLLAREFSTLAAGDTLSFSLAGIRLQDIYGASLNAATSPLVVLTVLGMALLVAAALKRSAGSKEVTAPTWLCGYQSLNDRTRYADRSMFSALKNFFWWTGGQGAAEHPAAKRGERS